ncbi:hypothetical protein VSS74_25020 [Conexibacter stalactiti]|uniref:Uncharacterized protein n=1 Tax=Conexibacter stalactiti TaxID=1940611 RepID=A0ABU4HY65_9ACTN|nr:hypothetical protein [Conexibacter stalactiti]MDW5597637.1 hypothetical protein [Conexibacter stalactiti]MEC5038279.1 hypothetical protein [Conexibacter stalactiti]
MRSVIKPVGELAAGDVVELDGEAVELMEEPFLGSRGASLLDSFELFWRARVRQLGADGRSHYVAFARDARVAVRHVG